MKQMKTVNYQISNITSLTDLVEMMRYDGMKFCSTSLGNWQHDLKILSERTCGLIDKQFPQEGLSMPLSKDQYKHWNPTLNRWHSFGMIVTRSTDWNMAQEL